MAHEHLHQTQFRSLLAAAMKLYRYSGLPPGPGTSMNSAGADSPGGASGRRSRARRGPSSPNRRARSLSPRASGRRGPRRPRGRAGGARRARPRRWRRPRLRATGRRRAAHAARGRRSRGPRARTGKPFCASCLPSSFRRRRRTPGQRASPSRHAPYTRASMSSALRAR